MAHLEPLEPLSRADEQNVKISTQIPPSIPQLLKVFEAPLASVLEKAESIDLAIADVSALSPWQGVFDHVEERGSDLILWTLSVPTVIVESGRCEVRLLVRRELPRPGH
ncbi:hypothetical protein HO173_001774 [Letharia columbiana]|uniref:Uncharacterized protein n=1 Tax=Letharia columbiana TaxID=112416 RepID=A0A8H6L8Z3_9LECA|nr:uncharacterized protein HO173_001774 [Letharia columbiana]KAF6240164.1 hypothetical protein HO173_001774 [Letharia columbiana]